jgi:hypothetical protein
MKKYAAIFLVFIYTLSVIGLAVNKFYCCGKLESVSFVANPAHIKAEKETKNTGCCKNEKTTFQVKESHFASDKVVVNTNFIQLVPVSLVSNFCFDSILVTEFSSLFIEGPPRYQRTPIYLFNCIFRI